MPHPGRCLREAARTARPLYYCYMLRCRDGTLYTGVTTDVGRRASEHDAGRGARYTAARRPVRVVWVEEHPDRSSAQRREAEIKRWPRRRKRALAAAWRG
jgi:putative endonuclease